MRRRRVALFAVVALMVVSSAPAAMADHCYRCRFIPPDITVCVVVSPSTLGGYEVCFVDDFACHLAVPCGPHATASIEPLATQYTIASVERLDEPAPGESLAWLSSCSP